MTTAVAIQPAMPRPTPVPIAAARPRKQQQRPSPGKENVVAAKPVSTNVGPVANIRTRRERPCDACRRRKSRCVIHEGAVLCVLCEFHKQECTFVQSPLPRKRKVVDDGKKDSPNNQKKRSVDAEPPPLALPTPTITATAPSPPPTQTPLVNSRLPHLGETLGLQRRQHSRYIGLSSPFDSVLIGLSNFDTRNESTFDLGTLRRVNDHECFIMLPDENTQDYADEAETLNLVEQIVHPHGPALLDIYFRIVHPSFPIIQKHLFVQRYRHGDRSFSPSLMAGMYVLALNWWSFDPNLANYPKPDAARLESIAMKSLSLAMERPKLSTVQAGLLLLQRPEADSWSLTTQLVAIGQELGLHLDCSSWSIPLWERGLRKRIGWALYMQDKWSSLIHGRPSHVFNANWAVKTINDEDFKEEGDGYEAPAEESEDDKESERGRILFAQMIGLTKIMAEIMDTFYTQVAIQDFANAGKNSTALVLERARFVQLKLRDWFQYLPKTVSMEAPTNGRFSSLGYLHLAYFATEITLHRRFVQSLDGTTASSEVVYNLRTAAKTRLIRAMDFVNRLKPEHLQGFWYFASKINFTLIGTFGSLLWATAPSQEEADFYKTRLREYRWTLSVSSKRADFLDYAVSMLDASRAMLNNLAEKPKLMDEVSRVGVPPQSARERNRMPPPSSTSAASAASRLASARKAYEDTEMMDEGDGSELRRYPSSGSFHGFENPEFAQYGGGGGMQQPGSAEGSVKGGTPRSQ
ncbi:fungal-specific transcription factor domain-domain-containing protein [Clohesyomyces aquaticus]|uniref:Fungal-specific transcription factor domain-domain-containing protein n=1 Tax=Clohesyomyces aquaticus TaxID=1231657 RepID=A0A1Y1ZXX2_9PLEO|nr:fungal-specific transcription factor domain-domain-containing protein [Clohesyomyces aquaticus]